jgi:hypothetical protein
MSAIDDQTSFASGRYSKRKRTQVNYHMDEMDVSDSESDFEHVQVKVCRDHVLEVAGLMPNRSVKLSNLGQPQKARSSRSWNCLQKSGI